MIDYVRGNTLTPEQLEELNTTYNRNWSRAEVIWIDSDTGATQLKVYDQRGHASLLNEHGTEAVLNEKVAVAAETLHAGEVVLPKEAAEEVRDSAKEEDEN